MHGTPSTWGPISNSTFSTSFIINSNVTPKPQQLTSAAKSGRDYIQNPKIKMPGKVGKLKESLGKASVSQGKAGPPLPGNNPASLPAGKSPALPAVKKGSLTSLPANKVAVPQTVPSSKPGSPSKTVKPDTAKADTGSKAGPAPLQKTSKVPVKSVNDLKKTIASTNSSNQHDAPKGSDYADSTTNVGKEVPKSLTKGSILNSSKTSSHSTNSSHSSDYFYSNDELKRLKFTTMSPEKLLPISGDKKLANSTADKNKDTDKKGKHSDITNAGKAKKGKSATEGSDYGLIDFSSNAVRDYQDTKDR
jgi:hypothetical protein